jgi:hypothetical protein
MDASYFTERRRLAATGRPNKASIVESLKCGNSSGTSGTGVGRAETDGRYFCGSGSG